MYKEANYDDARKLFTTALNTTGYQPELAYNIALCYYQVKQYGPALKHIAEIIETGVTEHPELSVGAAADGAEVRSVGNSQARSPFSCTSHVFNHHSCCSPTHGCSVSVIAAAAEIRRDRDDRSFAFQQQRLVWQATA